MAELKVITDADVSGLDFVEAEAGPREPIAHFQFHKGGVVVASLRATRSVVDARVASGEFDDAVELVEAPQRPDPLPEDERPYALFDASGKVSIVLRGTTEQAVEWAKTHPEVRPIQPGDSVEPGATKRPDGKLVPPLPTADSDLVSYVKALEARVAALDGGAKASRMGSPKNIVGGFAIAGGVSAPPVAGAALHFAGVNNITSIVVAICAAALFVALGFIFSRKKGQDMKSIALVLALVVSSASCAAVFAALPAITAAATTASEVISAVESFVQQHGGASDAVAEAILRARAAVTAVLHAADGAANVHDDNLQAALTEFEAAYRALLDLTQRYGVRVGADGRMGSSHGLLEVPAPSDLRQRLSGGAK